MYNDGLELTYAKVPLPKADVPKTHPFLDAKNHEKLLKYLQARLLQGKRTRDNLLPRLIAVDKSVSGWLALDEEDRARVRKKAKSGSPQAVELNLPLSYVQVDDMLTYFAQIFAPNRGMFYQTGEPDDIGQAAQIVTLMNNHAIHAGYYRETLLGLLGALLYNRITYLVSWTKEYGPDIKRVNGTDQVSTKISWQGNRLEAVNPYNFLYDSSVPAHKLHSDGEFAAQVEIKSHFWLQSRAMAGMFYNCQDILDGEMTSGLATYYVHPEVQVGLNEAGVDSGVTNWQAVMSEHSSEEIRGHELSTIYIRLIPSEFGLKPRAAGPVNYEIWRFTVLNNERVIDATHMNNVHGMLPTVMGVLNENFMNGSQKSTAETLAPLQDFASFLMNTHVRAVRKNLWGITIYDPMAVDLDQIPAGEVAGRVPLKPSAQGRDVRTVMSKESSLLDTKQTLQDLEGVMGIIERFFPAQSLPSQIAGIDRAVSSQIAAVQQGTNRRQQKSAKLLDDSVFRVVRFLMYYNLIQYQPDQQETVDYYTGKEVTIDLNALRQTDLPFVIGQGLKALDRQQTAEMIQQVLFAMIQAPAVAERIDILGLFNFWTDMLDIDLDLNKFKLEPPQAQDEGIVAPGQAAGDTIQPATNPQAITSPIYGAGAV